MSAAIWPCRVRALARTAWTGFLRAAEEIARQDTFTCLAGAASFADINRLFARE